MYIFWVESFFFFDLAFPLVYSWTLFFRYAQVSWPVPHLCVRIYWLKGHLLNANKLFRTVTHLVLSVWWSWITHTITMPYPPKRTRTTSVPYHVQSMSITSDGLTGLVIYPCCQRHSTLCDSWHRRKSALSIWDVSFVVEMRRLSNHV